MLLVPYQAPTLKGGGGEEYRFAKGLILLTQIGLYVCLFNRSLRAETHLGPDGTRLKQDAQARLKSLYKHAGQLVFGNVQREKQI